MEAKKNALEAIVKITGCDLAQVTAFINWHYLGGLTDPKRLTFRGLQYFKNRLFRGVV
jgi:hypothetical protein